MQNILSHLASLTKIASIVAFELNDQDIDDCIAELSMGNNPHAIANALPGMRALRDTDARLYKQTN